MPLARGLKAHSLSWRRQRPQPPGLVLYAARTVSEIAEGVATLGSVAQRLL
jgi:GntR family transcriptional regulator / MocR family aminotransferase